MGRLKNAANAADNKRMITALKNDAAERLETVDSNRDYASIARIVLQATHDLIELEERERKQQEELEQKAQAEEQRRLEHLSPLELAQFKYAQGTASPFENARAKYQVTPIEQAHLDIAESRKSSSIKNKQQAI